MSDSKERTVTFALAESPKQDHERGAPSNGSGSGGPKEEDAKAAPPASPAREAPNGDPPRDSDKKNAVTSSASAEEENSAPGAGESATHNGNGKAAPAADTATPTATDKRRASDPKDVIGAAAHRPKFVFCEECGKNISIEDWPDHRDRLRKVNLVEHVATFQLKVFRLIGVFLMWVLRSVYFREVTLVGRETVPKAGATVFYGNHQNQFIDALMLNSHCGREVRFIMAEKSFHQPVIGSFGRMFNSVPVIRPQDVPLTPGAGKLVKMEGATVTGENSTFTKSLSKGDVIRWTAGAAQNFQAQVSRIHSDTELEVTIPIPDEGIITTPTEFMISRRIDHSVMYAEVYNTLQHNHCIGIFPEGGSHDHTSLLPLKAGVALFSLGAAERNIPVKVVPCGLTYLYGHKFRSRAYLEFGEPITPSDELVELFGRDKREATARFLVQLNDALRAVTINVPDWGTLKFLHSFRQLYTPANCTLSAKDYLRLTRRLSVIIEKHTGDADFDDFRARVAAYKDFCAALMVRDSQVTTLNRLVDPDNGTPQVRLLLRRLFALFLMGVLLVPFFALGLPVGIFLENFSTKKSKAALAASKVKVVGADVKGSFKILTAVILLPLETMLVTFIIFLYTDARIALTVGFSLPMAMYVSLLILQEAVMEMRAALPLLMSLMSQHKQFKKLYEKRENLAAVATALVRKYDPDLESEMKVYTQVSEVKDDLGPEPSLFSLRYNVRRRQATNA